MEVLGDSVGAPVDRARVLETTALGGAGLAGMRAGLYPGQDGFAETGALVRTFRPAMGTPDRELQYAGWKDAVARTLSR